ncbi:hypothetical protein C8J56DRAFT_1020238 [Mycena floridula]|nr:hypothetical protein C8J56DRAFT_1020238 [Mycena floridula]
MRKQPARSAWILLLDEKDQPCFNNASSKQARRRVSRFHNMSCLNLAYVQTQLPSASSFCGEMSQDNAKTTVDSTIEVAENIPSFSPDSLKIVQYGSPQQMNRFLSRFRWIETPRKERRASYVVSTGSPVGSSTAHLWQKAAIISVLPLETSGQVIPSQIDMVTALRLRQCIMRNNTSETKYGICRFIIQDPKQMLVRVGSELSNMAKEMLGKIFEDRGLECLEILCQSLSASWLKIMDMGTGSDMQNHLGDAPWHIHQFSDQECDVLNARLDRDISTPRLSLRL